MPSDDSGQGSGLNLERIIIPLRIKWAALTLAQTVTTRQSGKVGELRGSGPSSGDLN